MFAVKLKLGSNCLLNGSIENLKSKIWKQIIKKVTYGTFNPIDWKKTKCVICNFPLIINAKGSNFPAYEISYTDFYMRYEHKFLRNIFSKEEESYMGFLIDF